MFDSVYVWNFSKSYAKSKVNIISFFRIDLRRYLEFSFCEKVCRPACVHVQLRQLMRYYTLCPIFLLRLKVKKKSDCTVFCNGG